MTPDKTQYRRALAELDAALAARLNRAPFRVNYKNAKLRVLLAATKRRLRELAKILQK